MKQIFNLKVIFLISILILSISCTKRRSDYTKFEGINISTTRPTDTLKFTSGIRAVFQDRKGNYWFGSDQEGICKFDGKSFRYYTVEDGLTGKQIHSIKEDELGIIWLGTNKGVFNYDGQKINKVTLNKIENKWALTSTDLWFGAGDNIDIIRVEKQKAIQLQNPLHANGKLNSSVLGMTGYSKGKSNVWIALYSALLGYDGKKLTIINDSTLNYDGQSEYIHIRSILEDSKGRLWIGNNGIGVLLQEGKTISNFSRKFNLVNGPIFGHHSPPGTLMHVFAIKEDSQGNIWFGDRDNGAWRYDGKKMKNFIIDSTLKTQQIWDIYEDNKGNLLFAMADKGVYKFNGKGFERFF